jgi:prepilin-type N-terminal cleavage/methylation domain-containing protein
MIDRQAPHAREAGFTLIEMAIVIVIAGMILTFVISAMGTGQSNRRDALTRERMALIAKTLANYAAQYNRLPCSASPNPAVAADLPLGVERGSGVTNAPTPCAVAANAEGILPFRALGLPEDMARDAWGRYFTYRVSPAFTRLPTADNPHALCRLDTTWVSGGANLNPTKARFCCAAISTYAPATDVLVLDASAGARVISPANAPVSPNPTRDAGANYAAVDTGVAAAPAATNLTFTFALVSHGANGHGAFLVNGTVNRLDVGAGNFGTDEGENADADVTFVDRPRTDTAGTNYFDDIVIWRTQNSLYQEIGGSCAIPR